MPSIGDKRLFTIATFGKTSLDKQAKDLREKHLMVFDQDKLSRVELEVAGKPPLEFGRAGTDWQILKPKPMRADGFQVDDLVRKLKDASMDPKDAEIDPKPRAAAFMAGGQKTAIAKVTGAEGTLTFEVRKAKDDYYAKASTQDAPCTRSPRPRNWRRAGISRWMISATRKSSTLVSAIPPASSLKRWRPEQSDRKVRRKLDLGRQNRGFRSRSRI